MRVAVAYFLRAALSSIWILFRFSLIYGQKVALPDSFASFEPGNGDRHPLLLGPNLYRLNPVSGGQHRLPGHSPLEFFSGTGWLFAALDAKPGRPAGF